MGVDIVVGTPGRLVDHLERGNINLTYFFLNFALNFHLISKFRKLKFVVLDEADQMLDIGFKDAIESILWTICEGKKDKVKIIFLCFFFSLITRKSVPMRTLMLQLLAAVISKCIFVKEISNQLRMRKFVREQTLDKYLLDLVLTDMHDCTTTQCAAFTNHKGVLTQSHSKSKKLRHNNCKCSNLETLI